MVSALQALRLYGLRLKGARSRALANRAWDFGVKSRL